MDIYTLKPMAAPSDEHIIHSFLGGSLRAPLLDESTNSKFGHSIDGALNKNFQDIILRLDLRGDTNKGPPRAKNKVATDEEGRDWRLTAGGRLECESIIFRVFEIEVTEQGGLKLNIALDGGEHLTVERATEMVLKRLMRDPRVPESLRQRPREAWERTRQEVETVVRANFTQTQTKLLVTSSFEINSDTLRAITKIACNFFAYHNREAFCGNGFSVARNFVLDNKGEPPVQLFYPPPPQTGGMCHGVAFDVHDSGDVTGTVILFGQLCHRVYLGKVEEGAPPAAKRKIYVVDQFTGSPSLSGDLETALAPFDHSCSLVASIEAYLPLQRNALIRMIEVADMVRELARLPEEATESDRTRVIAERTARVINTLIQNGVIRFR